MYLIHVICCSIPKRENRYTHTHCTMPLPCPHSENRLISVSKYSVYVPTHLTPLSTLQVFDQYVKTRAEEERKEKKNKIMQVKDDFRKMMEEAKLGVR